LKKFKIVKIEAIIFYIFALWSSYQGVFVEKYFPAIIFSLALIPIAIVIFEGRKRLFNKYSNFGIFPPFSNFLHYGASICYSFLAFSGLLSFGNFIIPYNFLYKVFPIIVFFWVFRVGYSIGNLDIKEFE